MVCPPNQMSLSASAPRLSLATSTAPAAWRRFTTAASSRGDAIAERLRAIGGRDAGGIEKILGAPRNAVQRPAILAGRDFRVGLFGLLERQVASQRDHAAQLGIELLQPLEIDLSQPLGGKLALLDPARKLCHRGEGDVCVICRQRARIVVAADKLVALWPAFMPGSIGFHRVAGASDGSSATLRGPVRRSYSAAIFARQAASGLRALGSVISICTSFSASAKVAGDTSGPTAGAVPNAGGAPGGKPLGVCAGSGR